MRVMNLDQLKQKTARLPLLPGVYIMKDEAGKVIYVGKAKKLKNRVSQYFLNTAAHSVKTLQMVGKVRDFDVIVCSSEFEALVLECSLIKQHKPKYNILLKDDKGYPYLRIDMKQAYPQITMVGKIAQDGAEYYGPYGSRSATNVILETVLKTLGLPTCSKVFPRDIGKYRVCLNYHMKQCAGWCQQNMTREEYLLRIERAKQLLSGHYKTVSAEIEQKMLQAAEEMRFEQAAALRDQLKAVELLKEKQLVATVKSGDVDVIGFAQTEVKACFAVLHFSKGVLVDKEYEITEPAEQIEDTVSALLKQYYLSRGFAPKTVLLPCKINDSTVFSQLLEQEHHLKVKFSTPQRGNNMKLVKLAQTNALEEAERVTDSSARDNKILQLLGRMLNVDGVDRIESFDISNISGTDTVASMVVFLAGKPRRSEYKLFQIRDLDHQDDYGAMRQAVRRRFERYQNGDNGFAQLPDILLIDGGTNHAIVAVDVLRELEIKLPVFGMVKDDRHRTRALVTPAGDEIRIDNNQSVFSLIGNIQEETHRFAINYHKKLRSRRLKYSELDGISGIGPKRKQELLKKFKSISAISTATLDDLQTVLPVDAAHKVYQYFEEKRKGRDQ